jgi:hypothetical protein
MSLIRCPECRKNISETAENCPKCGYHLTMEEAASIRKKEENQVKGCGIGCLTVIVIVLLFMLYQCSSSSPQRQVMNAEFESMSECLEGIQNSSGCSLKIVSDTPTEVSGLLSNGQGFACQIKTTGTKGTYCHGWYFVK